MTRRYIGSLMMGILVGLAVGVFLGWQQFPVEYTNNSLSALSPRYQEEYTVMVAEGYQYDHDLDAALERLRPLSRESIFDYVEDLTERYISLSNNIAAIPPMVALAEAMGRLTPPMEIYRPTPESSQPGLQ